MLGGRATDWDSGAPVTSTGKELPGASIRPDEIPPPDLAQGARCPTCHGGPLVVSGVTQLHFSCPQAHIYFLSDLLTERSDEMMADLKRLLSAWGEKAVLLNQVAQDARMYGYQAVAVTFERQAKTLGRRLELLRQGLNELAS